MPSTHCNESHCCLQLTLHHHDKRVDNNGDGVDEEDDDDDEDDEEKGGDAGEKTILTHIVDSIDPLKAFHYREG